MQQAVDSVTKSHESTNLDEPLVAADHVHIKASILYPSEDELNTYEAVKMGNDEPH